MNQLITAEYKALYKHGYSGDMYDIVKRIVQRGNAVPIDINIISAPTHPMPIPGTAEDVFFQHRLDTLIEHLNNQYDEPTNGMLHFQLRGIAYYHLDRFPEDIPLDTIATDEWHVPDSFTLRVLPFYQPYIETENPPFGPREIRKRGLYHARGLIDMHAETVIAQRSYPSLLTHEIGHGIFGYEHHPPKGDHLKQGLCIMNADNFSAGLQRFCTEDRTFLEKLAGVV